MESREYIRGYEDARKKYEKIALENAHKLDEPTKNIEPFKVKKEQWMDTKCICGHIFSKSYEDGYYSIPCENQTNYCPDCGRKLLWD